MKVFKVYFKIFKKSSLMASLMYVLIFAAITVIYATKTSPPSQNLFNIEKCKVAIIDNDHSELSNGLQKLLSKNTKIIQLNKNDTNNIKDVLFFRIAECIYTIPKGFENSIKSTSNEDTLKLQLLTIPDSTVSTMVNQMVNKYTNIVSIYTTTSNMDIKSAVQNALDDLEKEVKVTLIDNNLSTSSTDSLTSYFNYLVYPLIAMMILIVSMTMIKLNETNLKRRNICSPMHMSKFNMELFIANIFISIIVWAIFILIAAIMFKGNLITIQGILFILNSFVFTICCLSMAFLISYIASEKTVSAIATVFSLLFSFIGGAFVPQKLLSSTVKSIGTFVPSFWYIKSNNIINDASILNTKTLKPYITSLLIQICFSLAFFAISLVIIKYKRTSEQ